MVVSHSTAICTAAAERRGPTPVEENTISKDKPQEGLQPTPDTAHGKCKHNHKSFLYLAHCQWILCEYNGRMTYQGAQLRGSLGESDG